MSRRKMPEYLSVLNVDCLDEALDLCIFSFKEYANMYKFYAYQHSDLKTSKHSDQFLKMTLEVCKFVYYTNSSVKLMNYEFSKICLDWFNSLQEVYQQMGKGKFYLTQIATDFAQETFMEYISRNYSSPETYLDLIKPTIKKLKKTEIPDEEFNKEMKKIKFKENNQIKGLTEIVF